MIGIRTYCGILLAILFARESFAANPYDSPTQKRPNVLLIILDDWGCDAGCYGTTWVRTPSIDRLAADSYVYERAFTPNAKCAPSRAVLLTGRQSWLLGPACNHMPYFPTDLAVFTDKLPDYGYSIGATGKVWSPGVALDSTGKPRSLCGQAWNSLKEQPPAKEISNNDYASNFEKFLEKGTEPNRPWFFWCGPAEPHRAYERGCGVSKGGKKLADIDRVPAFWPDNETVRGDMLDYAFEVEHVDTHIGRMLDSIKSRGEYDNTLILLTSDHGPPFPRMKGDNYWYSHRIPLIVHYPRHSTIEPQKKEDSRDQPIDTPLKRIQSPADMSDIAPTILSFAAGDQTGQLPLSVLEAMQPMTGRVLPREDTAESLARAIAIGRERHDAGRPQDVGYPVRGLIDGEFMVVHNFEPDRWPACNPETGYLNCDGSPTKSWVLNDRRRNGTSSYWDLAFAKRTEWELYCVAKDPDCLLNLAGKPEYADRLKTLQHKLVEHLSREGDPRILGQGSVFDSYAISNDESRGFYDRFLKGLNPKAGWVNDDDFEQMPVPPR